MKSNIFLFLGVAILVLYIVALLLIHEKNYPPFYFMIWPAGWVLILISTLRK